MRRSSVDWWLLLCFALLLLLAGFGAVRADELSTDHTPPSSSNDSPTLGGLSETLTSKLETLKARLIERSQQVEQLRLELSALQTELSETSSSLQRLRAFLSATSASFESYRVTAETMIEAQAAEIARLQTRQWIERGAWIAAIGAGAWLLSR